MTLYNFADLASFKYNNVVLGATAVIGVIGGIYLLTQSTKLVASRIAERKTVRKKKDEHFCNVCFTSIDTEDLKTCIACCSCAKYVCRGGDKCSEWVPKGGEWICRLCSSKADSYGKTSTWVEEQLSVKKATPAYAYPMRARSEIYIPLCDPSDSAFLYFESVSEAPSSINVNQKQQIREYIEEVLAEMLGGSLDSTPVGQLSRSEHYIPAAAGGNEQQLQGISHVRLRRLIESIIAETVRASGSPAATTVRADDSIGNESLDSLTFNGNHCNGNIGHYFAPKKYQDLLATAVLNKIVDTHGNSRHTESSPDLTSSTFDKNHNSLFPNKTDESISSSSSIEPRSESSLTDPVHGNNKGDDLSPIGSYGNFYTDIANENIEADRESDLSDFIASHMVPLPHISAEPASDEEDDGDEDFISVASSGRDTNWEDNWLFKKKKSSKTAASIGMLVPAPKDDVRALIGDRPTDEVSDLSEIGSDSDDSSLEMVSAALEPVNGRLMNQHLIGGKNTKVVLDELVEENSLISTSSLPDTAAPYIETKNECVASNDGLSESESSKISVNNCNAAAIGNEAVNANVTQTRGASINSVQTDAPAKEAKQCDDVAVPPPHDFTDDDKMRNLMAKFSEEHKPDSGDDNSESLSPRSSISCALSDRISSESNQTDDSTTTVIDTFGSSQLGSGSDSEPSEEFSPDELTNHDSTSATITTTNTITTNNVTNKSHINSPPPPPPPECRTESACSKLLTVEARTGTAANEEHVDDDPLKHLVPGSIAEREYKKWYNAVEMPNNPYSAEALKRRLSGGPELVLDLPNISPSKEENTLKLPEGDGNDGEDKSQERDYARYSRDYYINDAKHASGATRKRYSPATTPSMDKSFATPTVSISSISSSSIELNPSNSSSTSPVEGKLKDQRKTQSTSDIYKAVPAQVEEETEEKQNDQKPNPTVVPLTTEAISKLSSGVNSAPTTGSLTPSEDSDTIRIYDLKKQETRIIKEAATATVPNTPLKKTRPTELDITPSLEVPTTSTPSSKTTTPTSFKFLQPKRKLINPSQVLSIDQDTDPITPTVVEKNVIEEEVAHAMPSVKALARAFLLTSSTCTTSDKWRKARTKSPTTFVKPSPTPAPITSTTIVIQKPAEQLAADTTSQGSEDATIASDLSSLETDPPSKQDTNAFPDQANQERTLSPVLVPGCLKNNIAFFENLKNK